MPGPNPTAGQSFTFTCTVTPPENFTGTPTVQWMGPGGPITDGGDFTVSSVSPYTLTINLLRQSYNGTYTCQATFGDTAGSAAATLAVTGNWYYVPVFSMKNGRHSPRGHFTKEGVCARYWTYIVVRVHFIVGEFSLYL